MSEIVGLVRELQDIDNELKRLRKVCRDLRARKTRIESEILFYLEEKDQPGIKYRNLAIVTQDKTKRIYTKKVDKLTVGEEILEKYGIENPKEVLGEVLDAMKGPSEKQKKIALKKIRS